MMTIYYDEYVSDLNIKARERSGFYSWKEIEDWVFGLCASGKYSDKISVPIPDRTDIWKDGPSAIEVNCCWTEGKTYRIHKVTNSDGIVFSDGRYTSGQRHWNDEAKNACRSIRQRAINPTFNFV